MAPLGWKWAALVWAYTVVWFRIKLLAYRVLDRVGASPSRHAKLPMARHDTERTDQ
jgi:hypothetical protein